MKHFIFATFFLGLLTSCLQHSSSLPAPVPGLSKQLDSLLERTEPRPFSGIVLIQQQEQVRYSRGTGLGDNAGSKTVTEDRAFVIGSLSKQVTAALALRESQRGNLQLEWRIGAYLPRLPQAWKDSVTVAQLLNHTHGITSLEDPLAFAPGTDFAYSNLGYQLLGEILFAITGQPYAELVTELFEDLGMAQSAASPAAINNLLPGFYRTEQGQVVEDTTTFTGNYLPAALLLASARDLASWNQLLHQGGLLDETAYRQMTTPVTRQKHTLFGDVGYGYGLRVLERDHLPEIGHTGYVPGYVSLNLYYPDQEVSVIVLENLDWRAEDLKLTFCYEMGVRAIVRQWLGTQR